MNRVTVLLGVLTLPLIALYPFMKRITFFPQVFLGVVFNFGALMGWSAAAGSVPVPAVLLYISGIFWTLGYDTIYAAQDMEDDAVVGIKSTALKFGRHIRAAVVVFYSVHFALLIAATHSVSQGAGAPQSVGSLALLFAAFGLSLWSIFTLNSDDPHNALARFKFAQYYGVIVVIALFVR